MLPEHGSEAGRQEDRIREAQLVASLDQHDGWKILQAKFQTVVDQCKEDLAILDLSQEETQKRRYVIYALRLVTTALDRTTPEAIAKMEEHLAFLRKQDKMMQDRGLAPATS